MLTRIAALLPLLVACTACTTRVQRHPIAIVVVDGRAQVVAKPRVVVDAHVDAEVEAEVQAEVEADVQADADADADADAYAEPPAPVPIQGAEVVEFFGIPLDGAQDVVFVLDRSGSMSALAQGRVAEIDTSTPPPPDGPIPDGAAPVNPAPAPRKIDIAHAELVDALERLPAGTRMNVLYFNESLDAYAPGMIALDEAGRPRLVEFVRETEPTGSTALAPAMRTAFLMNARRIILLSDGLGNVGGDADAVLRDARQAMRGGVRIDTIGLGRDQDGWLLNTLAVESGGLYQPL